MGFQIQTKPTPAADWSQFGPVLPDQSQAIENARRVEQEIMPKLRKLEPMFRLLGGMTSHMIVAVRVMDENGKQVWESPTND